MAKSQQLGFTLIEVMLVIAITGSLLLIAFVGQGQLRAQAQFDASVNKIVSTIAEAHDQANAAVSTVPGAGDGTHRCPGAAPGGDYVFAGIAWVATGNGQFRMDYYEAVEQSAVPTQSCVFSSQDISLPSPVQVNISNPPSLQGGKELFIRSNDVLNICPETDNGVDVSAFFRSGACNEGTLVLTITDDQGRKGQVTVDKSGLAQRNF